jgi:hypothetical protein
MFPDLKSSISPLFVDFTSSKIFLSCLGLLKRLKKFYQCKVAGLKKEANCTEPSRLVSIPCLKFSSNDPTLISMYRLCGKNNGDYEILPSTDGESERGYGAFDQVKFHFLN